MPFQIFSQKPGTSSWQQQPIALDQGILAVYNAATNTSQTATDAQAGNEAFAYAQAWVAAQNSGRDERRGQGSCPLGTGLIEGPVR